MGKVAFAAPDNGISINVSSGRTCPSGFTLGKRCACQNHNARWRMACVEAYAPLPAMTVMASCFLIEAFFALPCLMRRGKIQP